MISGSAYADCTGCCSRSGGVCCFGGITKCCNGSSLSDVCRAKGCNACGITPSPLVLSFNADKTSGTSPLEVNFTSVVSGGTQPYTYFLNFGDGTSSTYKNSSHNYTTPGTYSVNMKVTDARRTNTDLTVMITVIAPLKPLFNVNTTSGSAPLEVNFSTVVSGGTQPYTYLMDFGDGTTVKDKESSHIYNTVGVYTATLTVTDAKNLTVTESVKITVTPDSSANLIYFPHIASDGVWETEICVVNMNDNRTVNGILKAYDSNGKAVSEDKEIILAAHARKEITVGKEFISPDDIRYIVFESDSEDISGYTKFYIAGKYRVALPIVSKVGSGDIYISHIASDSHWWTGIALLNTASSSKELTIEFDNGKTKYVTLSANSHKSFTVRNLFDEQPQPDIHSAVIKNAGGVIGLELFSSTDESGNNYLEGILLKDTLTSQIYYPHIASDSVWWTGIVAYNPSSFSSNITVIPYSSEGNSLTTLKVAITGKGKYVGVVSDLNLPDDTAWFRIESERPITGFELFATHDGNQLAGYVGTEGGNKGIFAKIEKEGWTGIAFVNNENSKATVTLTAYDNEGSKVATETMNLNPYQKVVNYAEKIFRENITNATYISYSSDKSVVGFQLNGSSDGRMLDGLPRM